jgi:DNA polymerase (family 10)
MDRREIAQVLDDMAVIFELTDENPFKIRAYQNAARVVEGMSDLEERIASGSLTEVPGIGKNLADHITELYKTGKIKEHERLRKSIPPGVIDMLSIQGLGPKRVKIIYKELKATDIGQLELLCRVGAIRTRKHFGPKIEENILQGISYLRRHLGEHLSSNALAAAVEIFEKVKRHPPVKRAEIAGSIRRRKELVKDIDIVASSDAPKKVMDFFTGLPEVEKVEAKGETKSNVILKSGISADLRVVSDKEFPYALHHFTGSKEHNIAMRGRAQKMGMKMNEYGLFSVRGKQEKIIPCKDETEIFARLGLEYIEPELREDMGEIAAAENGTLPKLVTEKDVKGIIHVHSNYSDGINTIEELARYSQKLGYSYLGICDHSQSAGYAGGLKPAEVKKQWEEINEVNKKLKGFTVLKGIEVDILTNGSLDYNDELLEGFDLVIASVHSKFNMTEEEMTSRLIKAISHPNVDILGHPTGRLLLSREAYKVDMHKVIDAAAKYNVAIEINANPHRLDLDWRLCPYAHSKGVKIAVCPDAHTTDNIHDIFFGVGIARKGWLTKEDVVNAWPVEEFIRWLKK